MYLFVDEQNLLVLIGNYSQSIQGLSASAIASGIGQIVLDHPELFEVTIHPNGDGSGDAREIDIKHYWADNTYSAIGLDGWGTGETVPEAIGWLFCISEVFEELPDAIAQALEESLND